MSDGLSARVITDGVTRAGWTAFVLGVGIHGLYRPLMLIAPHLLISAFLDMNDPKNLPVMGYAASFLMLAAFFQLADGAQAVGSGMLRGFQDTRVPMIYAAIGYWGIGFPSASGWRSALASAASASGSASPPVWAWSRPDVVALDAPGPASTGRAAVEQSYVRIEQLRRPTAPKPQLATCW